jgi:lipopolysaccharide assembly outer membrane protein LptD (OstA)
MRRNLLPILSILLCWSLAWTANGLELVAPGGGEMDLQKNIVKYYGTDSKPVEARWNEMVLQTSYLEYYREQEIIKGKNGVNLVQNQPEKRTLKSLEATIDLRREFFTATKEVFLTLRDDTTIHSGLMEWDQKKDEVRFNLKPLIHYQQWRITGDSIIGNPNKGLFTVYGPVVATNDEIKIKAGKVIFNRELEHLILKEEPILIKGDNQLTATEIIYNLKTEKVTAQGVVKTKIIKE